MNCRRLLLLALGGVLAAHAAEPDLSAAHFDLERPDISSFIDQVVSQDGLDRAQLLVTLAQAKPRPELFESMNKAPEKTLEWWQYRARFVTPERVAAGADFWRKHRELLDEIALERGVEPEYLVAVLGVETNYGRNTGQYRVLDTLMTFAFGFPSRGEFYRKELEQFLLLARDDGIDPLSTLGSYGGAMGALQFMPSSYRQYAVNRSGGARVDLWGDWDDVLASIANFLHGHGWQYGAPVLAEAQLPPPLTLMPPDKLSLTDTVESLRSRGLTVQTTLPPDTPAILLGAPAENAMGYRVGFENFYVITRYNPRVLYAMAVYDLATAIKADVLQDRAS